MWSIRTIGADRQIMQFTAEQGTPHFGTFAGNFGGSTVQDTALNWSGHSHGEGIFGSTLSSGDRPPAS